MNTTLVQRCRAEIGSLVGLAVPLVAGLTTSSLLMITDTWMLGPLGAVPLAAASLTGSVVLILWAALYGFMTPVGLLVARAFGTGDDAGVASVVAHGRWFGVGIGVASAALMLAVLPVLSLAGQPSEVLAVIGLYWITMACVLVPYSINLVFKQLFDAVERPWTGVAIMFVAVVVNVPLSYALINGAWALPRLGLPGAAVATLVSETISLVAFYPIFLSYPVPNALSPRFGLGAQANIGSTM